MLPPPRRLRPCWNDSVVEGVKWCFPDYDWKEWLFACAPNGFWTQRENRLRYLRWLGRKLGYRRPQDWRRVRRSDFVANYGSGLVLLFHSHWNLLRDRWPNVDWKASRTADGLATQYPMPLRGHPTRLRRAPLSVKQMLRWADAHHRRTGKWPRAGARLLAAVTRREEPAT